MTVNRDKIKIVEFGMDGDGQTPSRPAEGEAVKIIEFDNDASERKQRVATARTIGRIKIVEFDDEPGASKGPTTEKPRRVSRPVKIRDFGEDEGGPGRPSGGKSPGIKIMEFD